MLVLFVVGEASCAQAGSHAMSFFRDRQTDQWTDTHPARQLTLGSNIECDYMIINLHWTLAAHSMRHEVEDEEMQKKKGCTPLNFVLLTLCCLLCLQVRLMDVLLHSACRRQILAVNYAS